MADLSGLLEILEGVSDKSATAAGIAAAMEQMDEHHSGEVGKKKIIQN